ncbi:type II 3-dehydroquinate dehydratase [Pseudochelatococcus sp. B33]
MAKVLFLNGPNLNLLGTRQPEIYGHDTLADLEAATRAEAATLGIEVDFRQSNVEGELVSWIHEARADAAAIVINAGAYTHTSIAIMDALLAFDGPIIELHLSNRSRREGFRHKSYVSLAATGMVEGLGPVGYPIALRAAARLLERRAKR